MEVYEVIRCPACGHTQKPRLARGQCILPCLYCPNREMEVYELQAGPHRLVAGSYDPQRQYRGGDRAAALG